MSSPLVRTLFQQLTRSAARLELCVASRQLNIQDEAKRFDTLEYTPPVTNAESLPSFVRREFDTFSKWTDPEDIKDCIHLAFKALREAELRIQQLESDTWCPRAGGIHFRVGQLVRHKKYGYRAVVMGWDEACKADLSWKRRMRIHTLEHEDNQPFYNLLVDQRDDSRRDRTYAAQENLEDELEYQTRKQETAESVASAGTCTCILHPSREDDFDSFTFRDSVYRPNETLRGMYPED
jgi:hemimethylated DNA binding protein